MFCLILNDPKEIRELQSAVITLMKSLHDSMVRIDQNNAEQYRDSDLETFVILHERYEKAEKLWHKIKTSDLPNNDTISSFTHPEPISG